MYIPQSNKFYDIPLEQKIESPIKSLAPAQNGDIWLATMGEGLKKIALPNLIIKAQSGELNPISFDTYDFGMNAGLSEFKNTIMNVFEDHSGTLWIGTFFAGLYKLPFSSNRFSYFEVNEKQGELLTVIIAFEDRRKNIWVSTVEGGLYKWVKQSDGYLNYRHDPNDPESIPSNSGCSIFEDHKGRLWVNTDKGLSLFDEKKSVFHQYQHIPNAPKGISWQIFEDKNGMLWFPGYRGGLSLFDPEKEIFLDYKKYRESKKGLNSNLLWHIYEDSSETIWIASANGLYKVVKTEKEKVDYNNLNFELQKIFEKYSAYWIHEDKKGRFWVSTLEGLVVYDRKEKRVSKVYKGKVDFPLDVANSIMEDGSGNLWLFGGSGIVKFDPEKEIFQLFDKKSGISYAPFGRLARENKDGWFLTVSGKNGYYIFAKFLPAQI